jgi:hypothetical protein
MNTMDQVDNNNSTIDFQENVLLEMMKEHISNGLTFQYETNRKRFNSNYFIYPISFILKILIKFSNRLVMEMYH